jgi:hypothetical protein
MQRMAPDSSLRLGDFAPWRSKAMRLCLTAVAGQQPCNDPALHLVQLRHPKARCTMEPGRSDEQGAFNVNLPGALRTQVAAAAKIYDTRRERNQKPLDHNAAVHHQGPVARDREGGARRYVQVTTREHLPGGGVGGNVAADQRGECAAHKVVVGRIAGAGGFGLLPNDPDAAKLYAAEEEAARESQELVAKLRKAEDKEKASLATELKAALSKQFQAQQKPGLWR